MRVRVETTPRGSRRRSLERTAESRIQFRGADNLQDWRDKWPNHAGLLVGQAADKHGLRAGRSLVLVEPDHREHPAAPRGPTQGSRHQRPHAIGRGRSHVRFGKRMESAGRDPGVALAALKRKQAGLTFVANGGEEKPVESKAEDPKRVKAVAGSRIPHPMLLPYRCVAS